jgi:DNA invertase Pin-like site-specific DNA recombinase
VRAAIYARVSKAERDDPTSIPVQLAECRQRAKEEGWQVVREYADTGISAWNPKRKRPEFERLLTDVEAGRVDVVLVREQERLLRQLADTKRVQDLAEAGRLKLIACTMESDINFRRARDRDDFRKRASQAQFYSDFLSEKVRATKAQRIEDGLYTGGESEPFGYRRTNGSLVVDVKEAHRVHDAVRRLGEGQTATRIVRAWNAEGFTTSRGARWRTLRRTLLSDHLTGARGYPRILSDEEAAVARSALLTEERRPGPPTGVRSPLAGYVFCAACGQKMTTGSGYYRCSTSHGGCGRTSIKAEPLQMYVFTEIAHRWQFRLKKKPKKRSPETQHILDELQRLEERAKEIADEMATGKMPMRILRDASRQVEQRRKELTELLTEGLPAPEPELPKMEDLGRLGEMMHVQAVEFLRDMLRKTVERIVVSRRQQRGREFDPERVEIVWR